MGKTDFWSRRGILRLLLKPSKRLGRDHALRRRLAARHRQRVLSEFTDEIILPQIHATHRAALRNASDMRSTRAGCLWGDGIYWISSARFPATLGNANRRSPTASDWPGEQIEIADLATERRLAADAQGMHRCHQSRRATRIPSKS